MKKMYYFTDDFPFLQIIRSMIGTKDFQQLHFVKNYSKFKREEDQSTIFHKKFYENYSKMKKLFDKFIEENIQCLYGEPVVYQSIPTFRVHLPGNLAVGEWHKDKHYRDASWAEQVKEDNFFVPLTSAYGTNTVWSESREDWGDFSPIEAEYGEMIQWDASNLTHGNKENMTGQTRVSFDFRVIPESRYVDSDHLTINTKVPFSLGGYYKKSKMVYNTMS